MREILFDENGERIERSWSENQASQFSVPERVFQAYAVRHLGCIHLRISGSTAYVALRPSRVTRRAAAALESAIQNAAFDMAFVSVYSEGAWHHELLPSRARALAYVARLREGADFSGTPNTIERYGEHDLLDRHQLRELVRYWKPNVTMREMGRLLRAAEELCQDRFMIAEQDALRNDIVVREGGHGYPRFASSYLETWLGRSVLDHPDKHYGAQCLDSYGNAARRRTPVMEVVDITVYWPLTGHVHRVYTRALLPFTDPSGRTWIMTSSIEGRGVVA